MLKYLLHKFNMKMRLNQGIRVTPFDSNAMLNTHIELKNILNITHLPIQLKIFVVLQTKTFC